MVAPTIDADRLLRDLDDLARIGGNAMGGVDRVAYTPADLAGRAWVEMQLSALGLTIERDAAGNTIALYPGDDPTLPPLAIGSHTDTVPNGGRFDGALGVLAAIAAVRALATAGRRLWHPVAVLNFMCEEATLGGGTLGSRAMIGQLAAEHLAQPAPDGRPVAAHLRDAGIDPDAAPAARRAPGSFAAYVELHIEQGGVLAERGESVGLVEGIVGIRRFQIVCDGAANHAGTTPMAGRRDALVAAAAIVMAVRDIALAHAIVGTCGTLRVEPNAPNVIPGHVELGAEIRGLNEAVLNQAEAALRQVVTSGGGRLTLTAVKAPTLSNPAVLAEIAAACADLGLITRRLSSGAGHDAMCIAAIAPQAMLFVPSQGGISHAPDEFTTADDCVTGARVLLATLLRLDAAPPPV
ncbi:MAG: Zn-dependent hydrolase [Chloroflexi bacterium]|nr:Zn-dependent hydrolase [Chloroflexota bacterium]